MSSESKHLGQKHREERAQQGEETGDTGSLWPGPGHGPLPSMAQGALATPTLPCGPLSGLNTDCHLLPGLQGSRPPRRDGEGVASRGPAPSCPHFTAPPLKNTKPASVTGVLRGRGKQLVPPRRGWKSERFQRSQHSDGFTPTGGMGGKQQTRGAKSRAAGARGRGSAAVPDGAQARGGAHRPALKLRPWSSHNGTGQRYPNTFNFKTSGRFAVLQSHGRARGPPARWSPSPGPTQGGLREAGQPRAPEAGQVQRPKQGAGPAEAAPKRAGSAPPGGAAPGSPRSRPSSSADAVGVTE